MASIISREGITVSSALCREKVEYIIHLEICQVCCSQWARGKNNRERGVKLLEISGTRSQRNNFLKIKTQIKFLKMM